MACRERWEELREEKKALVATFPASLVLSTLLGLLKIHAPHDYVERLLEIHIVEEKKA